ncbi:sensor histidine kinase [uncultured Sphingomonas sp.]|uniref:sensor histidine kinase n=1 Tax=uncultured Sphingomonas sp. TaxID=158754 RepID=UPI0035CAD347
MALPVAGEHAGTLGAMLSRMPTGAKIFLILSAALLPLAIIAFVATLSTTRRADQKANAQLRVAIAETSRSLAIELIGDMTALTSAMNSLAADHGDAPSCARVQGVFAQQSVSGTGFMITDRTGRLLCGTSLKIVPRGHAVAGGPAVGWIEPGRGLALSVASADGSIRGTAFFSASFLSVTARPSGFGADYEATLTDGADDKLVLRPLQVSDPLDRHQMIRAPLGVGDLSVEMKMRTNIFTSPILIAMLLPILMWAAAASIAWFVVDRLLIDPLRTLRAGVAAYRPGETIDPALVRALPAREIRDLGETFRSLSRTLILHEAGLAEGLLRQTKLTREVHHRVKNNLQVISSLINLHARSASGSEAAQAYASIQRRVDALAVVHRHHYAELEDHRGVSLRAIIGELASNIRATAPEDAGIGIAIDIKPFLVTQDVAIAVTFLLTEIIELATSITPGAQIRLSLREGDGDGTALLCASSPALIDSEALRNVLARRYARVMIGLSRQLRAPLHHEPLAGQYEIAVAVVGKD